MGKRFALLIIAAEVILLAAMLLADFGILPSRIDPLSTKSISFALPPILKVSHILRISVWGKQAKATQAMISVTV